MLDALRDAMTFGIESLTLTVARGNDERVVVVVFAD
jgi:hypothetical protein